MKNTITVELRLDEDENLLRERVAKKIGKRGKISTAVNNIAFCAEFLEYFRNLNF